MCDAAFAGMQTKRIIAALGASTLLLVTACETPSGQGAGTGAVAGGLIGGLAGGSTGLLVGAAAGGLLGYGVGTAIERQDQQRIAYALESNQPVSWQNPETGNTYEVQPMNSTRRDGRQCREFRLQAEIGDEPRDVYGTACRQPDGAWEVMNTDGGDGGAPPPPPPPPGDYGYE